ncbi:MAG: O-antigen ligase domain-containing protein [Xenococcaceae cyanobacterium MO_207.B15]|nr:O-antigen ligase domain-containing protein [Xenococcaceae cyanobacterium MO_207.B15]
MKQRLIHTKNSSAKGFSFILQPAAAWTAILMLSFLTVALIFAGAGKILNLAFPLGSLVVGAFLYFRYPILYNGFMWWIWFLVALVRRLADYHSSYTEPSPILLAPYLVTGLTIITVFRHLPKAYRQGGLPFIIALVGVSYGFLIGLINMPPFPVTRSFLSWVTPLIYGFHLLVNWRKFPNYYQNIQRIFVWGILIMGIYGIVQFLALPDWDRLWLNSSGMFTAAGRADASGGMRVWSTMPSGEPFAAFMAGGLLLLFNKPGILNLWASGAGYLAFLLSTVRSAWIGWFAGLLTLASSLKAKYQMRLIIILMVMAVLVVPLATMEQFSGKLGDRFATFSNLEEDVSANARQELFKKEIGSALTNFVGDGIGIPNKDSALLSTLISLGWIGTICYVSGLLMLVFRLFQEGNSNSDLFLSTARAIVMSCLVRIPAQGTAIAGVGGMLLWGFLGLSLAADKYQKHQLRK